MQVWQSVRNRNVCPHQLERDCPNFFRLLLHTVASRLMHALRIEVAKVAPKLGSLQLNTLRLQLLKVAASVTQSARRFLIRLPRAL